MFILSFYIFSLLLSFTDYKKFIVPNNIVIAMTVMMLVVGFIESKIYISSIILSLGVLIFFIIIMLIKPTMILGGGDIKYMMIVSIFLGVQSFALFLVVTGLLQTITLLYIQKVKNRRIAAMVPIMFLSVIIVELLTINKLYPF